MACCLATDAGILLLDEPFAGVHPEMADRIGELLLASQVGPGEIVALIGHNGAGNSTLLRAVFGLLPLRSGQVFLMGERINAPRPVDLLRRGVVHAPQGNRVFADLTVQENHDVGGMLLASRSLRQDAFERVVTMFPRLWERLGQRAGSLSGGERQMLVLANALMLSPRLLPLDEPPMRLAPPLVTEALRQIAQMRDRLGAAVLIVEQKVREVLKIQAAGGVSVGRAGLSLGIWRKAFDRDGVM